MSVAATWIAMGYLPVARANRFCGECGKSEDGAAEGLRCTQGHFIAQRTGGCKLFAARADVVAASVEQGRQATAEAAL
jgi:NADH pyrophosphatase NudC (nudix superfamily)